jgi:hypothetical protein
MVEIFGSAILGTMLQKCWFIVLLREFIDITPDRLRFAIDVRN